ncbi:MAG: crossover junction endodeoxyribonuclease RuvC [Chlamydiia bacterium]
MDVPSQQKELIIIGIDPGTRVTGFGVIKSGIQMQPLDFGCIRPPSTLAIPQKYLVIFEGIEHLIAKYKPDAIAVETQFVYKNVQSAMKLGMARGMVLVAGAKNNIPLFEYAPKKAKLAVVGNGAASKEQVQRMVQVLLRLPQIPTPEDAADALALAICHANAHSFQHSILKSKI